MSLHFVVLFCVSVLFTSLANVIGVGVAARRFRPWASLLMSFTVVLIGYLAVILRAPMGMVLAMPVPVGLFWLYQIVGRDVWRTLNAYLVGGGAYVVFHVLLSGLYHYDSLIPGWRLHR